MKRLETKGLPEAAEYQKKRKKKCPGGKRIHRVDKGVEGEESNETNHNVERL